MAFLKEPSKYKRSILNQLKHLVSKTLYRAIEILLTPCCTPVIGSVESECDGIDYNITVTLTNPINLRGKGLAILLLGGNVVSTETWTDTNQIVFTDVNGTAGTYDAQVQFFMPTNSEDTIGVSLYTDVVEITLPSCA